MKRKPGRKSGREATEWKQKMMREGEKIEREKWWSRKSAIDDLTPRGN